MRTAASMDISNSRTAKRNGGQEGMDIKGCRERAEVGGYGLNIQNNSFKRMPWRAGTRGRIPDSQVVKAYPAEVGRDMISRA